jgi:phosphinothricin acetyltransferase
MIRRATAADAPAIAAIWNHHIRTGTVTFLPDEKSEAEVAALIAGPDPVFVAERAGVAGFARHFPFRAGRGYAATREHTILLAPAAPRGQGLGRALIEAVIADAAAGGAHSLWAGISGENADGRAFHAAMGFAVMAVLPEVGHKFGRWLDLVLMMRRL